MKYVFQFARILAFCLLGEFLHTLLPLPIPASIYGLILLLLSLILGWVKLEQVKQTGKFLVSILAFLFIPSVTGISQMMDVLSQLWLPILIAVIPATIAVFWVSGSITQWIARRKNDA